MKEIRGNIWEYWEDGYYIVVPTNGFVKKDNKAVMGRGVALQASQKFTTLSKSLGARIRLKGNNVYFWEEFRLITFPVKNNWWETADTQLITKSCIQLAKIAKEFYPLYMPKVGCGNGKLNWEKVRPLLYSYLKDKVVIVDIN